MAVYDDQQEKGSTKTDRSGRLTDEDLNAFDKDYDDYKIDEMERNAGTQRDASEMEDKPSRKSSADDLKKAESGSDDKYADDGKPKIDGGGIGKDAAQSAIAGLAKGGSPLAYILKATEALASPKNRKKTLFGGGIGLGLVGIAAILASSILPMKMLGLTTNLQNIFFSAADDAASRIDENILRHYIVKRVMPGMIQNKCPTTKRDKSCAIIGKGENMITTLWNTHREGNLEGKLAEKGIFEIQREGNNFYIRAKGVSDRIDVGAYNGNTRAMEGRLFAQMSRAEVRQAVKTALEDSTSTKRMRYKYAIGGLMERKYGIRRCITFCKLVDAIDDSKAGLNLRVNAFRLYLVERIILPHNEAMALAFECSLNLYNCADRKPADQNGEQLTEYQSNLMARLQDYRTRYGDGTLDDLNKQAAEIDQKGLPRYMIDSFGNKTLTRLAGTYAKISNPVGWIIMAADLQTLAIKAGPALQMMNYVKNSTTYVQLFAMLRTVGDEPKTGRIDQTQLGSISGACSQSPDKDQGGASCEASPTYQRIIDQKVAASGDIFGPLAPKAYAAESVQLLCDDGKPYPRGKLTCPEVEFGANSTAGLIVKIIGDIANNPLNFLPRFFAPLISGVVSAITDFLLGWIPSIAQIDQIIAWVGSFMMKHLLITPASLNPSGARIVEMATAGADVAGNEYAHFGQGGKALTRQQSTQIRARQYAERNEVFKAKPLYARLFDTQDSQSMVAQMALHVPSQASNIGNWLTSSTATMFRLASSSLTSPFTPATVTAQSGTDPTVPSPDVFGVTQYGYPDDQGQLLDRDDPEIKWDELDCSNPDNKRLWGDKAIRINKITQQPEHDETNPCMLYQQSVCSTGGRMDTELLVPCNPPAQKADNPPGCGARSVGAALTPALMVELDPLPNNQGYQSAVQDETTCEWYMSQDLDGTGVGTNIGIHHFNPHGKYIDSMTLNNAGQSNQIGVENEGGAFIWINYGGQLARVAYQAGTTKESDSPGVQTINKFTGRQADPNVDQATGQIALRTVTGNNENIYVLRSLADMKAGVDKVLKTTDPFPNGGGDNTFQGFATGLGNVYALTGLDDKMTIHQYSWETGKKTDTIDVTKVGFLPNETPGPHEPEGMQVTKDGVLAGIKVYSDAQRRMRVFQIVKATKTLVGGDTTNVPCAAGTDEGPAEGYKDGKKVMIRICNVQGIRVNSQISGDVDRLMNAAPGSLDFKGGGFRTMEEQIATRKANGCPDIMNSPSDDCVTNTAPPGYSNHQMGLAIDFTSNGRLVTSKSSTAFRWLSNNAESYGLQNYPKEPWHWSVDGK